MSSSVTLWMPPVEADGSSSWPHLSSATLDQTNLVDLVKLRDRHGNLAGELRLPAGDGRALLERLGLELQP